MKRITFLALALLMPSIYACSSSNVTDEPIVPEQEYPVSSKIKSIPLPPLGKRWVLNEKFSDEFNDGKLDDSKWFDHHPTWIGRTPGLFKSSQISFKDGMMLLKGEKMDETIVHAYGKDNTFNIACAAVVSKTQDAHYGYYECRFKANKTTLSTTFWLSTRTNYNTIGKQPENAEQGTFQEELDICECIGRTGDFSGKSFCEGMNSNVHYWFTPQGGTSQDIRANEVKLKRKDGNIPSDDFNVYGCWWKDDSNATFYLNNEISASTTFNNKTTNEPFLFTEPMGLNMVVETYPQPWISLPTDNELADNSKNTSYYDWVRAYVLKDIEDVDKADNSKVFQNHISFVSKPQTISLQDNSAYIYLAYTAGNNSKIIITVFDSKGKIVDSKTNKVYSGYAYLKLPLSSDLIKDKDYTVVAYLCNKDAANAESYIEADSFKFKIK